ncbi:hypothetical protein ARMGADRAFT_55201 [Armillaria gallica]|uniref:Uncharacterized protein n=1 Tax=Armillaria gallica TaxID=47427 RepID=A0A2H3F1P1_ARMGA|nr:hypothetical protein ARMGADRAFT_55201 [Armillaria gallica]
MFMIEPRQSVQYGAYKNVEGGFSKMSLQSSTRLADNVPHPPPSPVWWTMAKCCVQVGRQAMKTTVRQYSFPAVTPNVSPSAVNVGHGVQELRGRLTVGDNGTCCLRHCVMLT